VAKKARKAAIATVDLDDEVETAPNTSYSIVEVEGAKYVQFDNWRENVVFDWVRSGINYYGEEGNVKIRNGRYPLATILHNVAAIKRYIERSGHECAELCEPLMNEINALIEAERVIARQRLANGEAKFEDLLLVFCEGAEIVVGSGTTMQGAVITDATLRRSFFGASIGITAETVSNRSGKIGKDTLRTGISEFEGVIDLSRLHVRLLTEEDRAILAERGRVFRQYANGAHHVAYTGNVVQPSWWTDREYRSTGRIMLDMNALRQVEPQLYQQLSYGVDNDDDEENGDEGASGSLSDANLWKASPYLYGFSFPAKVWGRFQVTNVSPIQWRDDAFDKLVLPREEKEMVRALVEHNAGSFTDIVDGKGGGCIFLLHGPPGQGKTLTAETVSELLHKPLYMISVGELGTHPDELEKRLRTILDIATMWDAVLLLDEADIFLEARDEQNIVRNAMVGVFLRLLEYHQGVLFLTTNRVRNIDAAFYSRISVALKFAESDHAKRQAIWTNLLSAAGLDEVADAQTLAVHDINGRQIKTSIRLAQTLARAKGEIVTQQLIEKTISLGARFERS
jgi:hypothetical protein